MCQQEFYCLLSESRYALPLIFFGAYFFAIPLVKNLVPPRPFIFHHPLQFLNWSHAIIPGQSDVLEVIPTIFVLKHLKVSVPALDSHFTHLRAQREMCWNAEVNKQRLDFWVTTWRNFNIKAFDLCQILVSRRNKVLLCGTIELWGAIFYAIA